jgi:hypothetical protein
MDRPMQRWCLCQRCTGILACIALAVLLALHCHLHQRCAGVTALVAWASLPLLRWTHPPHCTRVAVSIVNWRLPCHNAIVTRQHT